MKTSGQDAFAFHLLKKIMYNFVFLLNFLAVQIIMPIDYMFPVYGQLSKEEPFMKARRIVSAFLSLTLLFMLYPASAPAEVVIPAPDLRWPEDGVITNSSKPIYSGASLGNVTIEIKIGGVTVTTATADQSGNWSCFQPTDLADGSYTVYAVASDGAGHTSAASKANTFTVDTIPPSGTLINSPANGSTINSNTPTVSGTCEANCTVHVYFDGDHAGTAAADVSGNWLFHHTAALEDGTHMIYTMTFDAAGNDSYSANICMFDVDATPPAAPVVSAPASATNNNRPAYTGTAEAGSTVTVITDGITIGTTTTDGSGHWSFTQPTSLADGSHTIKVTATDAAGNVSSFSNVNSFIVDTTPPAAPMVVSPANGSGTNHNTPNILGTAEANSTVTVFVDGSEQGTCIADVAGNWSFVQPASLSDGAHTVKARAGDAAGNVSVDSNTNTFTVDTAPPAAPSVIAPANGSITNGSTPVCTGTAVPNSIVHVFMDGSETGTITADGAGSWSFTSASPLYDGYHTVKASASDWLGNTSAYSNPNAFTVDTVSPDAPVITTPLSGSVAHVSKPILSGTAEPDSTLTVFIDGAPFTIYADGTGSWHTESSGLADGNHTISVQASDAAGNTGPGSGTNTFTVDTSVLPVITVAVPADGNVINSMAPDFSGTAEPKFAVDVYVDGAFINTVTANAAGAWSLNAPLSLIDGPHSVYAEITAASHTIQSGTNAFTVDTTPPAAPLVITPAYGSGTNDNTPAYQGTAEANSTVTVTVDDVSAGTAAADGAGNWSFTQPSTLADGSHSVKATAADAAGNISADSNVNIFTVDAPPAPPSVTRPVSGSTEGSHPFYVGNAEPNSTVTIFVDNDAIGTQMAGADGIWALTQIVRLGDGIHTVKATATDAAGNTSTPSGEITFTVDTVGVTFIYKPFDDYSINDNTPTIEGYADSNSTVTVYVDGNAQGTTAAQVEGYWSFTLSATLADGPHTAKIVSLDFAGNSVESDTITFVVDTIAPAAPVVNTPANGSSTNDAAPAYTGVAEVNSIVNIIVDGNSAGSLMVDGSGIWSFDQPTALADGSHTVSAMAADAAGNTSANSETSTFTVDTSLTVSLSDIRGVTVPVKGAAPVTHITETNEYMGTVSWSPADDAFKPGTVYTATVTLSAKAGFIFRDVTANFFTVNGAAASNDAGSGTVRAVFPATESFISAEISPASCLYDLSAPTDAQTAITFHDAQAVTGVILGDSRLASPADYSVNGNILTIKSSYLAGLNHAMGDSLNLRIVFDAGAECVLNVQVTDSLALHDATLKEIKAGGVLVAGFSADVTAYTVTLPYGTLPGSTAAAVTASPSRTNAIVSIAQAPALPGDAVITVTAMDETSVRTYTVRLILAQPALYDVAFIDRNETHAVRTVQAGASIGSALWPANPSRSSYTFGGWYTGQNGTGSAFSANTAVNQKLNVYAKWTANRQDSGLAGETLQPLVLLNGNTTGMVTLAPTPGESGGQILTIGQGILGTLMQPGFQLSVTLPLQPPYTPVPMSDNIVSLLFRQIYSSLPPDSAQGTYGSVGALAFPGGLICTPSLLGTLTCNTDAGSVTLPSNLFASGMPQGIAADTDAVLTFMSGSVRYPGMSGGFSEVPVFCVGLTLDGRQITQTNPEADMERLMYFTFHGQMPDGPENYSVFHLDENGSAALVPGSQYNTETGAMEFSSTLFGLYALVHQP